MFIAKARKEFKYYGVRNFHNGKSLTLEAGREVEMFMVDFEKRDFFALIRLFMTAPFVFVKDFVRISKQPKCKE